MAPPRLLRGATGNSSNNDKPPQGWIQELSKLRSFDHNPNPYGTLLSASPTQRLRPRNANYDQHCIPVRYEWLEQRTLVNRNTTKWYIRRSLRWMHSTNLWCFLTALSPIIGHHFDSTVAASDGVLTTGSFHQVMLLLHTAVDWCMFGKSSHASWLGAPSSTSDTLFFDNIMKVGNVNLITVCIQL